MNVLPKILEDLTGSWSPTLKSAALVILISALIIIAGSNVLDLLDFNKFHEEIRILHHYDPERVNAKDYAGQFLSKSPRPPLFDFLTQMALGVGIDLVLFHKLVSLACIFMLLLGGALAGWRVGGFVAAVAVAVLIAAQAVYQYQVNSAVPHAFAFPLLMWALVFLSYGAPYALAGLTVVTGLLYAPIVPILGLCLAWQLVIERKCLSSSNPARVADILVLVITGMISLLLVWMLLQPIQGYGASVPVGGMSDIYPENGKNGRYFYGAFQPLAYVFISFFGQFRQALPPPVIVLFMACVTGMAGYGLYRLRSSSELFRAFLSFIVPSIAACLLTVLFRPHLAYRYALYPLFAVLPVLFVYGTMSLSNKLRGVLHLPALTFMATLMILVSTLR